VSSLNIDDAVFGDVEESYLQCVTDPKTHKCKSNNPSKGGGLGIDISGAKNVGPEAAARQKASNEWCGDGGKGGYDCGKPTDPITEMNYYKCCSEKAKAGCPCRGSSGQPERTNPQGTNPSDPDADCNIYGFLKPGCAAVKSTIKGTGAVGNFLGGHCIPQIPVPCWVLIGVGVLFLMGKIKI
jgi:hypothetical protein